MYTCICVCIYIYIYIYVYYSDLQHVETARTACGPGVGSSGVGFEDVTRGLRMIAHGWPTATECAGTSHLKLTWVRGFKTSMLKPHILKHHIPEHPRERAHARVRARACVCAHQHPHELSVQAGETCVCVCVCGWIWIWIWLTCTHACVQLWSSRAQCHRHALN